METSLTKEDIEQIAATHINRKNLSRSQRRQIYDLIKNYIVENKISDKRYQTINKGTIKDFQIDPECLSLEVLLEVLTISEYRAS